MKHRMMLDGMRGGTKLEHPEGRGNADADVQDIDQTVSSSLRIVSAEADTIRKILKAASGRDVDASGELQVNVMGRSIVRVTLRRDRRNAKSWYLNLDGNPLTFLTGRNVYGWPNAEKQIVAVFERCLDSIEEQADGRKFPARIRREIEALNIHLNHLEFASYTDHLSNKLKFINAWQYMFRRANSLDTADGLHQSLEQLLNVKVLNTGYPTTFSVATLSSHRKVVMFTAYDKEEQLTSGWGAADEGGVKIDVKVPDKRVKNGERIPDDIRDRLRLEIALTNVWFQQKRVKTLADLVKYVEKRCDGDWMNLIQQETHKVMNQACLVDMWKFDGQSVLDAYRKGKKTVPGLNQRIPTTAWLAMLEARAEFNITNDLKFSKLTEPADYMKALKRGVAAIPMQEIRALWTDRTKLLKS